ncbi:MAG: MBL fold metallo-hydrolase [Verrucomicrobiae bacterium]|nr:MBL fold metallo-hydrolase [Verrucomicrobiae bacterium]
MRLTNLSAHPDIGSNSYLLELGRTRVVLDAGTHPKHTGRDTLPLYEKLPPDSLDAILVSHPHLDHIGALPVLMREHPGAAVIMSGLTREQGSVLLHNSVNVMKAQREELNEPLYPLYTHGQVDACVRRWMTREAGERFSFGEHDRVTTEFFRAGHVLGAVGMRLELEGHRIFYTGDVHFEDQTLTRGAAFPQDPVDTLIIETTRGDHERDPAYTREREKRRFGEAIVTALGRGGAVLVPVFAFGKTQELLFMLKELFEEGLVPHVPVHIGGLSTKMTEVTDRHSDHPDRLHQGFLLLEDFPDLRRLARGRKEPDFHPGAIYALSSGMVSEHTVSHRFARRILASEQNAMLFVGYADEEAPGGRILAAGQGGRVALSSDSTHESEIRCTVERFDFSGHSPREQLADYAVSCSPRNVFLVHGDEAARGWFKRELGRRLPDARIIIPDPGEAVEL